MNPPARPTSIHDFFDLWSLYDLVLDHDYMAHHELYAAVQRALADHFGERPISVLDLGCGSGRHLAPVLRARRVSRYEGHDLSPVAIEHAQRNFAGAAFPVRLVAGDLRAGLAAGGETFDVIFSGFTLHHFTAAERGEILRAMRRKLAPGGQVLVVDSMRADEESREQWLDRYCAWLDAEWRAIPPDGRRTIIGHIRECDQPGTLAEYAAHATAAGFAHCGEVHRRGWHSVWSAT